MNKLVLKNKLIEKIAKYRKRVEAYGVRNGKIYGGVYKDNSFGTFGGGVGKNTPKKAAEEEYREEGGYILKNIRRVPIKPVVEPWKAVDIAQAKRTGKEYRIKKYPGGLLTSYYVGDIVKKVPKEKGLAHSSGLSKKKFYTPEQVLKHLPPIDERAIARRKVIEYIKANKS